MSKRMLSDLTSAERKQMPVDRGALQYFPEALALLSMLSLRADRKHSPDADPSDMSRPQWVHDKSADHGDCLIRHQATKQLLDPELGLREMVHAFWRAGAQLQTYVRENGIDAVVDWEWEPPYDKENKDEQTPKPGGILFYEQGKPLPSIPHIAAGLAQFKRHTSGAECPVGDGALVDAGRADSEASE